MGLSALSCAAGRKRGRASERDELSRAEAALCGAAAGGASRILTAPFDVLKIRFQLQVGSIATALDRQRLAYRSVLSSLRKVITEEGVIGLWRGNLAATYLWIGYGAVHFPVYEALKVELAGLPALAPVAPFLAGGLAGLAATVATYPFDVIRTQFAAQGLPRAHETMASFVESTLRREGLHGLFLGLAPTALQIFPRMGLSFALYEWLSGPYQRGEQNKKAPGKVEREAGDTEDWWEDVRRGCRSALYGGVSGGAARVAVYPLDTLKRRMQAQVLHLLPPSARTEAAGLTHRFRSSRECLRHMVREEGFSALYKGMIPTLLKSVSSTAIIFGVYEALKRRFLLGPGQ